MKRFSVIFFVEYSFQNVMLVIVVQLRRRRRRGRRRGHWQCEITCTIILVGIRRTENIQERTVIIVDRVDFVDIRFIGIENGRFGLRANRGRRVFRTDQFVFGFLELNIVGVQVALTIENFDQAEHVWMIVERNSMVRFDDEDADREQFVFVEFHVEDGSVGIEKGLEVQSIDGIERVMFGDVVEQSEIDIAFGDLVHRTFQ